MSAPTPSAPPHHSHTKPRFTLEDDPDSLALTPPPYLMSPKLTKTRRLTLAMAITDDGITDEALVETLDRIRLQRESSGCVDNSTALWDVDQDTWNWDMQWEGAVDEVAWEQPVLDSGGGHLQSTKIPYTSSLPSFPLQHRISAPSSRNPTTAWQIARQALLTCRELIRTERHYLSSLNILTASETATIPPPLMIHYATQLFSVSERLLARMEEDPSAWGVAASFLSLEESVEGAFVGWCGVVASWFEGSSCASSSGSSVRGASGGSSPNRRLSKNQSEEDVAIGDALAFTNGSPLRRAVSTWKRNVPTMTSLSTPTTVPPTQGPPLFPASSFGSSFLNWRKDKERPAQGPSSNGNHIKRPPVRDLAILPTQRVLRYVLLYRDLLAHTPSTSPSRAMVERALEAACRIAQKCDRAQDNAAFLIRKPEQPLFARSSVTGTPRLNRFLTDQSKTFLTRSRKSFTG
ncbi:hypothetical protein AX17_000772 [Amanita inopinata Kibby_2008]|nr:hypothetical protein AX17_000772 [Amanita inopinata Kibby_2008]